MAENVDASSIFSLTPDKISSYPCDSAKQLVLITVAVPAGHDAGIVSDCTLVVHCPPSATYTLGLCHMKAENGKNGKYHKC